MIYYPQLDGIISCCKLMAWVIISLYVHFLFTKSDYFD